MEKIENTLERLKADDWWGHHNITTRLITLISSILLVVAVISGLYFKVSEHYDKILNTVADMTLYITLAIILGVNGVKAIGQVLSKIKNKD
jgi:hypothetical protein